MRTTFSAMYRDAAAGLETAMERRTEFQRQVATGKRMERASDDPSGAVVAIDEHAAIAAVDQFSRTATAVGARLSVADTVLSNIVSQITSAATAAQSARGTGRSTAEREAAAMQLQSARDAIFDDLNTSYQGAYLFAGASTGTAPFAKNGSGAVQAYAGSNAEVGVDIDRGRSVTVAFDGSGVAGNVFTVLDGLITAARNGDSAGLTQGMADLDAALQRTTLTQGRLGTALGSIDEQKLRLGQMRLAATTRLDKAEAANLADAISNMSQADAAYQAALGAVGAVTRVSLMDYIK